MNGYIKSSDRLPEIGDLVVLVLQGKIQHQLAYFSGEAWEWADGERYDPVPIDAMSHWYPVPSFKGKGGQ